jgi:hypothetical protein
MPGVGRYQYPHVGGLFVILNDTDVRSWIFQAYDVIDL